LSEGRRERFDALLAALAFDPRAPSSVRDPARARDVHVADSLSGLEVEALAVAARIADVGAGAGFPGLVLAVALPGARVDLIEANARKCEFIRGACERAAIGNATAIAERAETWAASDPPAGGRESYDAVTARAVGRLATLAELASPLLREGGTLVAWKGRRDPREEAELERARGRTAMAAVSIRAVEPYPGSRNRHLHVLAKTVPTPEDLPRRPGIAKKRPFGS
jgi:16S rRNA (guanine527-N7)-methyltransferase